MTPFRNGDPCPVVGCDGVLWVMRSEQGCSCEPHQAPCEVCHELLDGLAARGVLASTAADVTRPILCCSRCSWDSSKPVSAHAQIEAMRRRAAEAYDPASLAVLAGMDQGPRPDQGWITDDADD